MKYRVLLMTCLIAAAGALSACDKPETPAAEPVEAAAEAPAEPAEAAPAEAEPAAQEEPAAPAELAMVEVSAEGTEFDPPVEPAQIPEGAWYCDMGTVHYAQSDEGEGKCKVCGMMLKEKTGGDDSGAQDDDHAGHGHD